MKPASLHHPAIEGPGEGSIPMFFAAWMNSVFTFSVTLSLGTLSSGEVHAISKSTYSQ